METKHACSTFMNALSAVVGVKSSPRPPVGRPVPPGSGAILFSLGPVAGRELAVLQRPDCLDGGTRDALFRLMLDYTARAFNEPAADMEPATYADHLDHTVGGHGFVCMLGKLDDGGCPILSAHANLVLVETGETRKTTLYLKGICCDPLTQGRGLASGMLGAVLPFLQSSADYFAFRTMNIAVVRMATRALCALRGSPWKTQDESGTGGDECTRGADDKRGATTLLFPVAPFDPEARPDVVEVARTLAREFAWAPKFSPRTLLHPGAYPKELVPVFMGKALDPGAPMDTISARVTTLLNRPQGDAMLCVADI